MVTIFAKHVIMVNNSRSTTISETRNNINWNYFFCIDLHSHNASSIISPEIPFNNGFQIKGKLVKSNQSLFNCTSSYQVHYCVISKKLQLHLIIKKLFPQIAQIMLTDKMFTDASQTTIPKGVGCGIHIEKTSNSIEGKFTLAETKHSGSTLYYRQEKIHESRSLFQFICSREGTYFRLVE